MKFDKWWISGGQYISEKKYKKSIEALFCDKQFISSKVVEYYGESSIGDKVAENNVFWYVMEEMARKDNLHLL